MADLIYCGRENVGPVETRAMLEGPLAAIWSPPMWREEPVVQGDRLWLLRRPSQMDRVLLLGGGYVMSAPGGRIDWTNRTAPGAVAAARQQGYGGPTNMAFLRLDRVRLLPDMPEVWGLGDVPIGLSRAAPAQVDVLARVLPI